MSDYTPTTDEVRREIALSHGIRYENAEIVVNALAGFDRWLAKHDAEVTAQAEKRIIRVLEVNIGDFTKWLTEGETHD